MIENSGNSIIFYWHYTENGVSKTGLTVTADVYEVTRDGTATQVVTDGACTAVGDGIYRYILSATYVDAAAEYIAVAHTATDTVDAQDIPAMWVVDRAGTNDIPTIKAKTDQLAFSVPNKVDASATIDPTGIATDSHLQDVEDKIDKIEAKTDLLDFSKVNVVTPVNGSTITIHRGDTLEAPLSNLSNLASYVSLDFTVKRTVHEPDDNATIRIRKNVSGTDDGLLRLNGAAYSTSTDGSIAIDDAAIGDITITLKAGVTKELVSGNYVYDIQLIEADEVSTLTSGALVVSPDVTRLVA